MMFSPNSSAGGLSAWATGTAYVVGDVVTYETTVFICITAHTSGTFATDAIAGKWKFINVPATHINLVSAGNNFEDNTVGGWTATGCATVTNGLPVSVGSGGTAFSSSNGGRAKGANTSSPAVDSSSAISGTYSLNLATTGAGTIGDGYVSGAYLLDPIYRGQVLAFDIAFKVASGTPVMGGTSSDTYAVAIYDVANNAWFGSTGVFSFNQSSGVGHAKGTFQTLTTSTSFQIFVYSPVAPTGASSLLLDDILVSPQLKSYGPFISDTGAQSWTPTGSWSTNTTYTGKWRRDGDLGEYDVYISLAGAPTSAALTINLPSGHVMDTTKIAAGTTVGTILDSSGSGLVAGGSYRFFAAMYNSTTSIALYYLNTTANNWSAVTQAAPGTFANGDTLHVTIKVPISGWSAFSQLSSDADTRVVAASYTGDGSGTQDIHTSGTILRFDTSKYDTHAAVTTGASWKFTAPVAGYYNISGNFNVGSGGSTDLSNGTIQIFKNGSAYNTISNGIPSFGNSTTAGGVTFSEDIQLSAGDYIDVRNNFTVTTLTLDRTAGRANINIKKISGPSQIAASESVNAKYTNTAGTSVTGSLAVIPFVTKAYDSHGAWDGTNKFTAPVAGKYKVSANLILAGIAVTTSQNFQVAVYKNGSIDSYLAVVYGNGGSNNYSAGGSTDISLLAGDYVQIFAACGGTTPTLNTTAGANWVAIARVGN